jgi:hypothetical protein
MPFTMLAILDFQLPDAKNLNSKGGYRDTSFLSFTSWEISY